MKKSNLVLEQSGLIIELFNSRTNQVYVTYSACTHGGWAKYMGSTDRQIEFFADNKSEVIEDANKIAKYYNATLEVNI